MSESKHSSSSSTTTTTASTSATTTTATTEQLTPQQQTFKTIRDDISLLERAVQLRDSRLLLRVLRSIQPARSKLTRTLLRAFLEQFSLVDVFAHYLPSSASSSSSSNMIVEKISETSSSSTTSTTSSSSSEEDDEELDPLLLNSLRRVFSPMYLRQPTVDILTGLPKSTTTAPTAITAAPAAVIVASSSSSHSSSTAADERKDVAALLAGSQPQLIQSAADVLPEIRVYLHLLVAYFLFDQSQHHHSSSSSAASSSSSSSSSSPATSLSSSSSSQLLNNAATCIHELLSYVDSFNRRSMDWLSSKIYTLLDLVYDRLSALSSIRTKLLAAHRTAVLQHNEPGQAALVVAILHNYVADHLYAAADTFRLKTTFPEQRSNNLYARYLYYTGLINAVQLSYSDAFSSLQAALRKAPKKAVGFRQRATKLVILVQLLMGEIPDRTIFNTNDLRHSLLPYLQLTRAVRKGDLDAFAQCQTKYAKNFDADKVNTLIVRLRHNVIKAGLRKINLAYSSISLKDIASKLHVDSGVDVEAIVVKAIADGVIDASVDHDTATVNSTDTTDLYATSEPQQQFSRRIDFCLGIRNDAVKAMRFPPNAYKRGEFDEDESDEDEEGNVLSRKKKTADDKKDDKKDDKDDKKKEDKKESK